MQRFFDCVVEFYSLAAKQSNISKFAWICEFIHVNFRCYESARSGTKDWNRFEIVRNSKAVLPFASLRAIKFKPSERRKKNAKRRTVILNVSLIVACVLLSFIHIFRADKHTHTALFVVHWARHNLHDSRLVRIPSARCSVKSRGIVVGFAQFWLAAEHVLLFSSAEISGRAVGYTYSHRRYFLSHTANLYSLVFFNRLDWIC